ncbi:hypothetical protein G6F57_023879 [Rhizopus arrhizus]|nr:hypothetical protein G6F31_021747 [Rhizopus arrhizus]KAG1222183.1 hypothetical protein G6F68_020716 [Rhizopus microsporus]KAG1382341.1 hypothetical protein G6F59_017859 [Rhizopus arrhizus]KAG1412264.1 hypothetical protein G6F57_023879 [Rhizopus arrhizus]
MAAVCRRGQAEPRGQGRRALRGRAGHAGARPGVARRAGARHRPGHRRQRVGPAAPDGVGQTDRPEARRLWGGAG